MFRPNTSAVLLRRGARNVFGKESFNSPVTIMVNVVRLANQVEETSVRADSTASRGAGEEEVLQAKLLVHPDLVIRLGDVIEVLGRKVEVASLFPRQNTRGTIEHIEVGGNIKGGI